MQQTGGNPQLSHRPKDRLRTEVLQPITIKPSGKATNRVCKHIPSCPAPLSFHQMKKLEETCYTAKQGHRLFVVKATQK